MKFTELNKKLKEEVKPLYNLQGGDAFLIQKSILVLEIMAQIWEMYHFSITIVIVSNL